MNLVKHTQPTLTRTQKTCVAGLGVSVLGVAGLLGSIPFVALDWGPLNALLALYVPLCWLVALAGWAVFCWTACELMWRAAKEKYRTRPHHVCVHACTCGGTR